MDSKKQRKLLTPEQVKKLQADKEKIVKENQTVNK